MFAELDIAGTVVTGDAMFTQHEIAHHLVQDKHAHYLLQVMDNQPTLCASIERLMRPLAARPPQHETNDKGHGRIELRLRHIWVYKKPRVAFLFPFARQCFVIERLIWLGVLARHAGDATSARVRPKSGSNELKAALGGPQPSDRVTAVSPDPLA